MNFEYLEETIIDQIEILVEELDGTLKKSLRCDSTGRQSRIINVNNNSPVYVRATNRSVFNRTIKCDHSV